MDLLLLLQNSTRVLKGYTSTSQGNSMKSVLLLQDIGPSQNGQYKCEATNSYGEAAKELTVNVSPSEKRQEFDSTLEFDCFSEVIFVAV